MSDGMIYFPDQLAKDIAKGFINFDNLTREQWNEIRSHFYFNRYGEWPEDRDA